MTTPATATPSPLLSESEALRELNLATTRREFLRGRVPHATAGRSIVYRRDDVAALKRQIEAGTDAVPQLQTR